MVGKLCVVLSLLICLLEVASVSGEFKQYRCSRNYTPCKNGGICLTSDDCQCSAGFEGFDCGLVTATKKNAPCAPPCQNGGICYVVGVTDTCYCQQDFWGPTCQSRRQMVENCDGVGSQITMAVQMFAGFTGRIFVLGAENEPLCVFTQSTDAAFRLTATLVEGVTNPCNSGLTSITDPVSNTVVKGYMVIVQHHTLYINQFDEKHTFTCSGNNYDVVSVSVIDTANTGTGLDGVDVTASNTEVNAVLTTAPARSTPPPIVHVGQELYVEYFLPPGSSFTKFRLSECTASTPDFPSATVKLVTSSCADPAGISAGAVVLSQVDDTILLRFTLFQFISSDKLVISCSVLACLPTLSNLCDPVICGDNTLGIGRRKRQAEEVRGNVTVNTVITVATTEEEANLLMAVEISRSKPSESDLCVNNVAFIAVAVVCGVLLMIAILALVGIFLRLLSTRKANALEK